MFEKIEVFEKRYDELNAKLYDPAVASDSEKYTEIMKELNEITPIVEKYKEYKAAVSAERDAKQMLEEGEAKISEIEMAEIKALSDLTVKSLNLAHQIFDEECFEKVFDAEIIENRVDETQKRIIKNHVERLMHENCDAQGSVIFTDMCTDLERCSDHAINIATALASSAS